MDEFRKSVREMRDAQKKYFKDRSHENLNNAKFWESRVDMLLQEDNNQAKLF